MKEGWTMANMDYLVIEDIHKSFYGVEVLKGVSFSAASGVFSPVS